MKSTKLLRNLTFITLLFSALVSRVSHAVEEMQVAPEFNLRQLTGEDSKSLKDFRGKVIYLDFWASWCGPCRVALPQLSALRDEIGKEKFEVVGINLDENPQDALQFLKRFPVNFTVLSDTQGNSPEAYNLTGMPTSYLIDKKGRVRIVHQGFRSGDKDRIKAEVKKLLQES